MPTMEIRNVNKYYGQGISRVHVLKDVNFVANAGEMNLILGPSGSGKSTFLTIAGGLQTPTSGEVLIDGINLQKLSPKKRDELRLKKIGFILQSYNLLPYLDVADQFKLVDKIKKSGNVSREAFEELLQKLAIKNLLKQYPSELSGGQNQRVAIARALYTDPQIILADEPTAALDSNLVKTVGQLFQNMAKEKGKAVIAVTHDLRLQKYADHIYELADGRLTEKTDIPQEII
ncbi:ABC transporter ATP-binding protein [Limosilactobacillus sp. STM2_1]|uniref:Putative hemin import ATP-binding protein HrtA n=1 Tax=Limosilactobacillus rudii TaxID=2759755 RepID=A0A7W3ULF7_9LACO|nr:ABC transporter ATP-binding protein [Limosilactobacillus rudii]MBB1079625.1 ABC transporter ATP-binding protein [Limosilactobacillus rudii]MBB1097703.1 ABC transporter ATP-binding protein [Limosilactobacillus rudii]MCD7134385.1 ABC transporter ATP-binding protein [Limosilactobacillus rudii]